MQTEFDALAEQTFTTISNLMGVDAVWLASNWKKIPGRILFKNPTEPLRIGDAEGYEYQPNTTTAEYYAGTFDGLKEAVDSGSSEFIQVDESAFLVIDVTTKFDGKVYVARLEPHQF